MKLKHSPARLLVLGGGFLMVIDTLLAWQSITVGGLTFTRNAWHGLAGVLVGLLSIGFLANAVIEAGIIEVKFRLPHRILAISLAPAILVLSIIKNLDDSHSGWASYVGILLAGLMTWGAWLQWQEQPVSELEPAALEPVSSSETPAETSAKDS